jgi:hypothetical protein
MFARESSGLPLFIDRVLLGWFQILELPIDRVFSESDEHSLAKRLLKDLSVADG